MTKCPAVEEDLLKPSYGTKEFSTNSLAYSVRLREVARRDL